MTTTIPPRHDASSPATAAQPDFDGVDLQALARRVGTPCYAYSASAIRQRIRELQQALGGLDATLCYAVKANSNIAILQLMAQSGVGADIVSAGELRRCLHAGIPADRIVFSGVGKSEDEIAGALTAGILRFNVESHDELLTLERLAQAQQVTARAAVRINPDVDAQTHAKISTGKSENKFGVSIDEARRWFAGSALLAHVRLDGLHVHIGSQILSVEPFRLALKRVAAFWRELVQAGHPIESIDVGGGLGVCYRAGEDHPVAASDYADVIRETLADYCGRLLLEPGRYLVAEAGVLLTRVIRIKHGVERRFLVLDAAMNDLQRPSLYDAWHDIVPVSAEHAARPVATYDIVGPVCETGDTFARARPVPECAAGDLLLIKATGAYGASMASTYNSRPLAAEVLLDHGRYAVVRRRQHFEDMIAGEQPARSWQTL
ncbi:diaminopimelate decarboxylase [Frateuria sp. Soil773]|uniref:diaminopimelate decarboxylase n=1 Tax=Frateuria sp. Soil773 TaxID=1736407 RepID=UPI0006F4DB49|nr:diaminopimelate decarboxylase [Frateuria sp. Soil773]KRE97029.1 diaminopimelate decarboxylase [Frateuria sp. Soil773]